MEISLKIGGLGMCRTLKRYFSNEGSVKIAYNGYGLAMWRYLKNVQPGTAAELNY
jgi:hypothetical protein